MCVCVCVCVCVLAFVQGEVVRVKASKIVAGQEVDRTNEFLQQLAIAILKKVSDKQSLLISPGSTMQNNSSTPLRQFRRY